MINILHIIHKYRGDYPLLNQQANLDRREFRTLVCYLSGADDGRNGLDAAGIKTIYLEFKSTALRLHNRALLQRLRKIMEDEDIHVVNCQQHRSAPMGILAAQWAANRPAVVVTLHGLATATTMRRKILNWFLYNRVYRIIGISHGVAGDIIRSNWRLAPEKVAVVQNGLVYDRFLATFSRSEVRRQLLPGSGEAGEFWFGTAGRLSSVKNHEALLRAFQKVLQKLPGAILLIAGDGELKEFLCRLTETLSIGRAVHFLGYRGDMPEILASLDVFLLPSRREGLPLAMLEAMASGLPVIASNVGGIPEITGGGDFARLISPDSPAQLAEAMIAVAQLPVEELRRLGEAARRRALRDFSAERMIDAYQNIYRGAYRDRQLHARNRVDS